MPVSHEPNSEAMSAHSPSAMPTSQAPTVAPNSPAPAPAWPRLLRDPWGWFTAACILPIVLGTIGTPRGEPFAEDFDFLHYARMERLNWLDGGGSLAFWRPIPHQLYYQLLSRVVLDHPAWIGGLHIALLTLGALLLYRALRVAWPGPQAAAAASFPLLAESTRTLVCWPGLIVDVGVFLFLAIAIHERMFRRMATSLAALLAALLCKELALIGVVLIPFLPDRAPGAARARTRWVLGAGAIGVVWALAYVWVRKHAHLELPHGIESNPLILRTPLTTRFTWALWNSVRACFSLDLETNHARTIAVAVAAIAVLVLLVVRNPRARARWNALRGWAAWGGAWGLASWLALASIFPLWAPNRSQLGSVGIGIGAAALAGAVHPALPLGITAVRAVMFALAPHTPREITPEAPNRGAFMDYPRLSRLQQIMRAARRAVRERFPTLPHGTTLGTFSFPLSSEYALGGPKAIEMWYGDSTLRWVSFDDFVAHPELPVRALVNYQPRYDPQFVLIDGVAARAQQRGLDALRAGRWNDALETLRRADSLQSDRRAIVFLGDLAGRRSDCLAQLGRWDDAMREARAALAAAPEDVGARYVVAAVDAVQRREREAIAQLDTLLAIAPHDEAALAMRDALLKRGRGDSMKR